MTIILPDISDHESDYCTLLTNNSWKRGIPLFLSADRFTLPTYQGIVLVFTLLRILVSVAKICFESYKVVDVYLK